MARSKDGFEKRPDAPYEAEMPPLGKPHGVDLETAAESLHPNVVATLITDGRDLNHKKAVARQRELITFKMRIEGYYFEEIGKEIGVTKEGARRIYYRVLKKLKKETFAVAEEERNLDLQRIEMLIERLWPYAVGRVADDSKPQLGYVDRVRKLLRDRARLLGLDAPKAITIDDNRLPGRPESLGESELESIVIDAKFAHAYSDDDDDGDDGTKTAQLGAPK